jgi:hypothetical protein
MQTETAFRGSVLVDLFFAGALDLLEVHLTFSFFVSHCHSNDPPA